MLRVAILKIESEKSHDFLHFREGKEPSFKLNTNLIH